MPKQIFQRPVPVRHDHWVKKGKAGIPAPPVGANKAKKPAVLLDKTGLPPVPAGDPEHKRSK